MNNQEAISVLESLDAKTDYFLINDDARAEALDMAISALQAQKSKTKENCDTCKHDPPSKKWPCVDCDMRAPADRWEAQDVPDNSDKDALVDALEKCGIMWSDKFEKVITAKELALFYGEKYETMQRKMERFSNDLIGDVREINKSDELFDRLKRNRVTSNKTPKIMVISPTGVAKIAYFSEGVKQHEVRRALSKINHRLHEELSVKYSDIYFLKIYQKEMSYLINNIFHSHKVENEKYVEGYRIDFLIDDHIAIECDESAHDYYNRDHEESRKKLMETKGYSFYRYDVRKKNMLSFVGDLIDKEMGNPTPGTSDMISRRFVELLAEYHDPEICPYKEYKGKPYFSIKYIENGEGYVGYGTYSPKVLSEYLRKYFMSSAQPEQNAYEQGRITGRVEMRTEILSALKNMVGSEVWDNV